MSEQQAPHVEVLSRNRIHRSTIIVAVIPVSIFSGFVVYALWQFARLIAYGVLALLAICAVYLVAVLAIDVRRRWIAAHVIHLGEYGALDAANWRMLPLALPPPVITEVKKEKPDYTEQILFQHAHGCTYRTIAESLGISKYEVEKTINTHRDKQA